MFETLPEYVGYLDTFKKLGVRPFKEEAILRKRLGDYVSIVVLRDILFSILLLSPQKYTSFLYSWGKFIGNQAAKQAKSTLKITTVTKIMTMLDPIKVLEIDIYRDAITKNWVSVKSFIPTISYVDERTKVFRIRIDECDEAWGLYHIGKKICFFEGAIMAGNTEGLINTPINAIETKCVARGDEYCEFFCSFTPEFPDLEIINKKYLEKIKRNILSEFKTEEKIRKKLGDFDHIAALQVTYLGLWLSSPGSHTVLYWIGKTTGEKIFSELKGSLDDKLKRFSELFKKLKIGLLELKRKDDKFVIVERDCAFTSGASNFGKRICSYTAGMISGFLNSATNKTYNVIETKCIANGNDHCEFTTM